MGVASGTSVGPAGFEFILLLPMAAGVVVPEAAVSVSAWYAWEAPALAGKAGHPYLSASTKGKNAR